jgi:hypothetical protein
MKVARFGFVLALAAASLAGCGPAVPPAGDYATVYGVVTDSKSGAPIPGASITVDVVYGATADAAGTFRIASVPTGPWAYVVTAPNYGQSTGGDNPPDLAPGEQRGLSIALVHL